MSVIYAAVAYRDTLLANRGKTDKYEKQFQAEIGSVLKPLIDKDNMRQTSQQNEASMFCQLHKQVTFICYCDSTITKRQAYAMLQDIEDAFMAKYPLSAVKMASRLSMDAQFGQILGQKMQNIKQYASSKLNELNQELEETKALALTNIQAIMQRAAKLDEIQVDAADLKDNAHSFFDNTAALKREMNCKRIKVICGVVGGLVVVIVIVVGAATKWFGLSK